MSGENEEVLEEGEWEEEVVEDGADEPEFAEAMADAIEDVVSERDAEEPVAESEEVVEESASDDADAPQADEGAPQTEDVDDYTPPEGLSEKANERFQELASKAKEASEEANTWKTQYESLQTVVQESRATPDEFMELVTVSKQLKSGDMAQMRQAYDKIMQTASRVAPLLGVPVPGTDPLDGFDDLRQRVDDLELDEAAAQELATARRQQQAYAQSQQQTQAQQQQMAYAQQEGQQAQLAFNGLLQNWMNTDPSWKAKEPALNEYAGQLLQQVQTGQVAPGEVPRMVNEYYQGLSVGMTRQVDNQRREAAKNQSLRPTSTSTSSVKPEPKNFMDGMMQAISEVQGG